MRTFEYGFSPNSIIGNETSKSIQNQSFEFYIDAFWVTIITMMTVGYGDIYPSTHFGRVVAFISAIVGMVIVSLVIVSMSTLVEFSTEEKKAHSLIKKLAVTQNMKATARVLISGVLKLNKVKKNSVVQEGRLVNYLNILLTIRAIVVKFSKEHKISKTQFLPSDEVLFQLQKKIRNRC